MEKTIKELNAFWKDLHQFDSGQIDAAMRHAMTYLCEKLGASNAIWGASVHFPNNKPENAWGWRSQAFFSLYNQEQVSAGYEKHIQFIQTHQAKQVQIEIARYAGTAYRTFTYSRDMPAEWLNSEYYTDYLPSIGSNDALLVLQPVDESSEAGFIFVRDTPVVFSDDDVAYASLACAPLQYLHKAMMLHYGIGICENPLTAAEKRLLAHLLQEKTEPEIAAATNLSPSTVHTYATRIYKKFGVKGRTGLMALWLSF